MKTTNSVSKSIFVTTTIASTLSRKLPKIVFRLFSNLELRKVLDVGKALIKQIALMGSVVLFCGALLGSPLLIANEEGPGVEADIDKANDLLQQSCAADEMLACETLASRYSELGLDYKTRGELDRAVEMYWKALTLFIMLDAKFGVSFQYKNLAEVHEMRGEWYQATEMYDKALSVLE